MNIERFIEKAGKITGSWIGDSGPQIIPESRCPLVGTLPLVVLGLLISCTAPPPARSDLEATPVSDAGDWNDTADVGDADAPTSPYCDPEEWRFRGPRWSHAEVRFPESLNPDWHRLIFHGVLPPTRPGETRLYFVDEIGGADEGFVLFSLPMRDEVVWDMPEEGQVVRGKWLEGEWSGSWVRVETLESELVIEGGDLMAFSPHHGADLDLESIVVLDETIRWECRSEELRDEPARCPFLYQAMGLRMRSEEGSTVPDGEVGRVELEGKDYALVATAAGRTVYDEPQTCSESGSWTQGEGFLVRAQWE